LTKQRAIRVGTLVIHKAINASKEKKPSRANKQAATRLARKEKLLVTQATRAILVLEADGSAIAFAEVFKQVRIDMEMVQKLLADCKVGKETQQIEQDILETLEDMIKALKTRKGKISSPNHFHEKLNKEMTKFVDRLAEIEEGYRTKVQFPLSYVPNFRPLMPLTSPLLPT
jgi:hypothetical protein